VQGRHITWLPRIVCSVGSMALDVNQPAARSSSVECA
jgi:hypothetical protein